MDNPGKYFKQANAYAMQYGLLLGVWGILSLAAFVWSLSNSYMSLLCTVMMVGSPVFAAVLTLRYRNQTVLPRDGFSFGQGFIFSFLMGVYASLWIAVATFIYMSYIDHGYVFDAYEQMLSDPAYQERLRQAGMMAELNQLTGGRGVPALADALRMISPATYAGMSIYFAVLSGPFFAAIIGLVSRRRGGFDQRKY